MDQTIVTFGDIEIEKMSFTFKNVLPFQTCINIYISNIYVSNIYFFYSGEKKKKTINTLLVTCMMFIMLNHYI